MVYKRIVYRNAHKKSRRKLLPYNGLLSRGDWMALELFLGGVAEWADDVKRLVMAA